MNTAQPTTTTPYQPHHTIRIVTAASLFDGHDAAINIMRRILQATGAEVIHLGHNRSVGEIVDAALQEDVQAVAITSYQGGHNEFFRYMYDLLRERGAPHIKIFGGGGGTILPEEIAALHKYGITRIYSPEDGRLMGLQGMINDVMQQADFSVARIGSDSPQDLARRITGSTQHPDKPALARLLTLVENESQAADVQEALTILTDASALLAEKASRTPVLGVTGTGGAGKSSLTDELVRRFLLDFPDKTIAILSVDPSKRKTGGALLGDRIRMNAISSERVFMRSVATRQANAALSKSLRSMLTVLRAAHFDLIIVETAGIGQSGSEITDLSDASLYVMTPEFGAATQLEKIDMLDYADVIALNKFDKAGALDALRDVKKQVQRSRGLWTQPVDTMPVVGTIASQFNDPGMNKLYRLVIDTLATKTGAALRSSFEITEEMSKKIYIIPPHRTRYLAEIADEHERYKAQTAQQVQLARQLYQVRGAIAALKAANEKSSSGRS
jgi:methylmalonyl-CoA mutase